MRGPVLTRLILGSVATGWEIAYSEQVPEVSRFFGIVIGLFYSEHGRPHFHAVYGENDASIDIETGDLIAGELPKRALELVAEWHAAHRDELKENWHLARQRRPLRKIAPLE